jgi:hypothetical protein
MRYPFTCLTSIFLLFFSTGPTSVVRDDHHIE